MSNAGAGAVGQAYALRAWITFIHSQIRKVQPYLQSQIEAHEQEIDMHQREIAQLRFYMERSNSVLGSLLAAIEQIDERLRNLRDSDILNMGDWSSSTSEQQSPSSNQGFSGELKPRNLSTRG